MEKARIPSPRITAEVLLMHAARCDRAHLFAHPEQKLSDCERVHYGRYLNERLQGKPTQYITGHQEFWDLDFLVNPAVLIPRPETEFVVETALGLARKCFREDAALKIADVGTGSGCIAVALAHELPNARFYALDLSPQALETAQLNARRNGVEESITFMVSDLLECWREPRTEPPSEHRASDAADPMPELDMVVSNPPYVSERDASMVQREVREFEPHYAVFAGESGLEAYRRLIPQAARALHPGGYLILELGYDSEAPMRGFLSNSDWDLLEWLPDLAGITRVVAARRTAGE